MANTPWNSKSVKMPDGNYYSSDDGSTWTMNQRNIASAKTYYDDDPKGSYDWQGRRVSEDSHMAKVSVLYKRMIAWVRDMPVEKRVKLPKTFTTMGTRLRRVAFDLVKDCDWPMTIDKEEMAEVIRAAAIDATETCLEIRDGAAKDMQVHSLIALSEGW